MSRVSLPSVFQLADLLTSGSPQLTGFRVGGMASSFTWQLVHLARHTCLSKLPFREDCAFLSLLTKCAIISDRSGTKYTLQQLRKKQHVETGVDWDYISNYSRDVLTFFYKLVPQAAAQMAHHLTCLSFSF